MTGEETVLYLRTISYLLDMRNQLYHGMIRSFYTIGCIENQLSMLGVVPLSYVRAQELFGVQAYDVLGEVYTNLAVACMTAPANENGITPFFTPPNWNQTSGGTEFVTINFMHVCPDSWVVYEVVELRAQPTHYVDENNVAWGSRSPLYQQYTFPHPNRSTSGLPVTTPLFRAITEVAVGLATPIAMSAFTLFQGVVGTFANITPQCTFDLGDLAYNFRLTQEVRFVYLRRVTPRIEAWRLSMIITRGAVHITMVVWVPGPCLVTGMFTQRDYSVRLPVQQLAPIFLSDGFYNMSEAVAIYEMYRIHPGFGTIRVPSNRFHLRDIMTQHTIHTVQFDPPYSLLCVIYGFN
jgi:hypothetical protein